MIRRALAQCTVGVLSAVLLPAQFRAAITAQELAGGRVAFGSPFELVVERQWPGGWTPEAFDEVVLQPLLVGPPAVDVEARADGGFVERRRYVARATVVGDMAGKPWLARWRGPDGRIEQVEVALPALHVTSVLPQPPADVEWAGDVREPAPRRPWWWASLAAVLGTGVCWWMARRGQPAAAGPALAQAAPGPSAGARALGGLRALALPGDGDAGAIARFYDELARIVREFAGERYAMPALVRTSEELVGAVPAGAAPLARCLRACDLVKFAAAQPAGPAHVVAHAAACEFVAAAEGGS